VSRDQLLCVVGAVERLAFAVVAWSGVITSDDEVRRAMPRGISCCFVSFRLDCDDMCRNDEAYPWFLRMMACNNASRGPPYLDLIQLSTNAISFISIVLPFALPNSIMTFLLHLRDTMA
jgi:hypothetical protein